MRGCRHRPRYSVTGGWKDVSLGGVKQKTLSLITAWSCRDPGSRDGGFTVTVMVMEQGVCMYDSEKGRERGAQRDSGRGQQVGVLGGLH